MREYKNRASDNSGKRSNSILGRIIRNWLSATIWQREFHTSSNIYHYDWSSWTDQFSISITWYGYKAAITIASVTAFFTGIGQLLFKLMGWS